MQPAPAAAHRPQQERLTAGEKHVEAFGLELLQHRVRVRPVAGAVLHAGDGARIRFQQPLDQREGDRDARDLWMW